MDKQRRMKKMKLVSTAISVHRSAGYKPQKLRNLKNSFKQTRQEELEAHVSAVENPELSVD